ncbi:HD domain-containing protein [Flavitalea sp.]|nr:HD domain-containing protein [Flavitalea sp.]
MKFLQEKVVDFVTDLFKRYTNSNLIYHNITHTRQVVSHATEIIAHLNLSAIDKSIVIIAAWFHDTGHLFNIMQGHEVKSVEIMDEFLSKQSCDRSVIDEIASCILATRLPAQPFNLKEEILCDADTYHLGTTEFQITDALIKLEVEQRGGAGDDNWNLQTLEFLRTHSFYTSYCKEKLKEGKARNIAHLINKITASD